MLCNYFFKDTKSGRVRELLINSEKARISSISKKDAERFLCLQFSITHANYPKSYTFKIKIDKYLNIYQFQK